MNFSRPTRLSFLLAILFIQLCCLAQAEAICPKCSKLKKAAYIGIKKVKEYLDTSNGVTIYANARNAKKDSLTAYRGCPSDSTVKRTPCAPAFGILADSVYLCPNQLKPFATEAKAQAVGYAAYTACGSRIPTPTPSPTPQVTPKPLTRSFTLETGDRFSDVDSISIARLPGGTYRSYTSASVSSFDGVNLAFRDSADGLSFGSPTSIQGISPEAVETFGNATFLAQSDGSYVIIYEEIKHISSAGLDIHNLMRAVSSNGTTFTYSPSTTVITGGSLISTYFEPALLAFDQSNVRLYHVTSSNFQTLLSSDAGATFGDSETVSVIGRSDSLAPYPSAPSVVREDSGTYLMFFASPANSSLTQGSIFLADSTDGKTFHTFDTPILSPSAGVSYADPTAIILPNKQIRLYIIERSGESPSISRIVKSALSSDS